MLTVFVVLVTMGIMLTILLFVTDGPVWNVDDTVVRPDDSEED